MNNVNLVGRLTADPELKYSTSGTAFCNFTLAVNRLKKPDNGPDADFIRCSCSGKTAESLCHYQRKGNQIGVNGRIQTGSYTNKQGQKIYTTDVIVNHVDFLTPKKERSQSGYNAQNSQTYYRSANGFQGAGRGWNQPNSYGYGNRENVNEIDSDDLPF